ncbi:hypothetical protein OSTOST_22614, partial [Ostertagia ostertagi]
MHGQTKFMTKEAWCALHFLGSCNPKHAQYEAVPRSEITSLVNLGCVVIRKSKEVTCFCDFDHCNRNFSALLKQYSSQSDAIKPVQKCLQKHQAQLG